MNELSEMDKAVLMMQQTAEQFSQMGFAVRKTTGDQLFQLADLEAEGLREVLRGSMQHAANEVRRVLTLPAGPLPEGVIDLLLTMCRDALVEAVPQPFLRVKK